MLLHEQQIVGSSVALVFDLDPSHSVSHENIKAPKYAPTIMDIIMYPL